MTRTLALFVPLALLTNTPLPVPFDPVLLAFVAAQPQHAALFVAAGTACAAAGAMLDALLIPRLGALLARRGGAREVPRGGRRFYLWTALVAASPLPFYAVRAAVLCRHPRPLVFGLAVAAGRLPRYALLVGLWSTRGAQGVAWLGLGLVVLGVAWWACARRSARLSGSGPRTPRS